MAQTVEQAKFVERRKCINCGSSHLNEFASGRYHDEPLHGFLSADPWGENPLPFLRDAVWSLVRCDDCSQMFHRFVLDEEWNHRRFSKWMSADAIKQFGLNHGADAELDFNSGVNDVEHILRLRRLVGKSPVTILDFGCGFGHFLQVCLHFAFDATGIDRSSGRRERGLVKIFPSLDDVQGRQFDAITLFQVLEHLDEPATVLKSLANSLKSGGYLILETPNCAGMIGINTMRDYRNAHPLEHINCFTHETLRSIAERRGFELIRRGPAFVTAQPYRVLKRIARHALLQDGKATDLYFRKH